MRKRMMGLLIVTIAVLVSGCSSLSEQEAERQTQVERARKHNQMVANEVTTNLLYFKDSSTNLCYAYYWGGGGNGGPALTLVPEDSIPPERLLIGRPKP